jgi:hypothetical protein
VPRPFVDVVGVGDCLDGCELGAVAVDVDGGAARPAPRQVRLFKAGEPVATTVNVIGTTVFALLAVAPALSVTISVAVCLRAISLLFFIICVPL